ncbi:hypothetical protein AAGF08_04050 [Algoriphagus sp. SE2]|uniref:hypothetical protein n=1 Tax=Algoriphagus sp. SE2 TaxID=3141536 RepID=UPI0031CD769A
MKRFITKTFLLITILTGIVYGVDYLIQEGIKTSSYREISKWNEVVEGGIDAEILIVGSSRALVHFDPKMIEESTGLICYNLGLDGSKYNSQEKVLELYLEHNKPPKIIYWSLDYSSFKKLEGIYRYEQFIPFWTEKSIKSILRLNKGMDLDYLNYPIARFSNNPSIKYRGLLAYTPIRFHEPNLYKGFRKPYQTWDGKFDQLIENNESISQGIDSLIFNDFVHNSIKLKEMGIEIRWIVSPYYIGAQKVISNSSDIIDIYSDTASELKIPFIDMTGDSISFKKKYFYNGSHLNADGVNKFSKSLLIEE